MSERMKLQRAEPPNILSDSDLAYLRAVLHEACSTLEHASLPDVLAHLDFNPGNIVVTSEKCVFLDWAEGSVASPFITFCYLREHALRGPIATGNALERLTASYLRPWRSLLSPSDISRGMAASAMVAVLAYALALDDSTSPQRPETPAEAGLLRSLARRMYSEAANLRSEICQHAS
jgi:hypothetical protein